MGRKAGKFGKRRPHDEAIGDGLWEPARRWSAFLILGCFFPQLGLSGDLGSPERELGTDSDPHILLLALSFANCVPLGTFVAFSMPLLEKDARCERQRYSHLLREEWVQMKPR